MPPPPPPKLTDYLRILMGDVPWPFLLEAALRLLILYVILLVGLRLMGKRMAGQFSRTELAALVSLAAGIGIPILSADRGVVAAVVIAAVVVAGQRLLAHWSAQRPGVERLVQGTLITVVADGVLQLPHMAGAVLSQERVFAQLRGEQLEHLGQVRRLYMEANGTFSLVEEKEAKPGLSLIPGWDTDFRRVQPVAEGTFACLRCGQVQAAAAAPGTACPRCQAGPDTWEPAVQTIPEPEQEDNS